MSPAALPAPARLAVAYALLFGVTGVSLPYAALWMRAEGLSGAEIGAILALPMLGRLVSGPLLAVWADGFRTRRTPIALLAATAAGGYGAAGLVDGFAAWATAWFVGATAAASLLPLCDVLAMRLASRLGFAFALPRGFGSAAFVAANIGMGALLLTAPSFVIGVWLVAGCLALAAFAALALPPEEAASASRARDRFRGVGRLLKNGPFLLIVAATSALHGSHAFYYAFSAVLWRDQGLNEGLTGLLWGLAVTAEIAFMWVIEPWRRRRGFRAWSLVALAGAAAVVRWAAMATEPGLAWLIGLQILHALSFAAAYLAGLELVDRTVPPEAHTAAQTVSSALSSGVVIGLATLAAGPLYDGFGSGGYVAMAALAAVGGAVAALGLAGARRIRR